MCPRLRVPDLDRLVRRSCDQLFDVRTQNALEQVRVVRFELMYFYIGLAKGYARMERSPVLNLGWMR